MIDEDAVVGPSFPPKTNDIIMTLQSLIVRTFQSIVVVVVLILIINPNFAVEEAAHHHHSNDDPDGYVVVVSSSSSSLSSSSLSSSHGDHHHESSSSIFSPSRRRRHHHPPSPPSVSSSSSRQVVSFDFGWKYRTGLTQKALPFDIPPIDIDPGLYPPESQIQYDDNDWEYIQLPHDGLIINPPSQMACPNGCSGRSYIPRHVLWYRKQFQLPVEWTTTKRTTTNSDDDGGYVWLTFEGSFRNTTVWVDGKLVVPGHACGYTPFTVDLSSSLLLTSYSSSSTSTSSSRTNIHTIAVFVDPDNGDDGGPGRGSGWWYEGGGLYRHVTLTRTVTKKVHIQPQYGLFVKSSVVGGVKKKMNMPTTTKTVPKYHHQQQQSNKHHYADEDNDDDSDSDDDNDDVNTNTTSSITAYLLSHKSSIGHNNNVKRNNLRLKRHNNNNNNDSSSSSNTSSVHAVIEMEANIRILQQKKHKVLSYDKNHDIDDDIDDDDYDDDSIDYCYGFVIKTPRGDILGSTRIERLDVSHLRQQQQQQRRSTSIPTSTHSNTLMMMTTMRKTTSSKTAAVNEYGIMDGTVYDTVTVKGVFDVNDAELWSTRQPNLYQIDIVLYRDCMMAGIIGTVGNSGTTNQINDENNNNNNEVDRVSVYHGIRTIRFYPNHGFILNEEHYKIRGFCDHDTFAVVGMAVPDRINLFRAQASRSIGGNGRRTSHNPPDPSLLDIYDRLGMVVMDENRLFDDNPQYVQNMADLVQRDRNHPSVVIWSFCNENGCEGDRERGGPAFQDITTQYDGTRPTLANMFTFNDLLSNTVDVQGFSHQDREKLDECHVTLPNKPIFMSECCSCNTMRDEDEGCETTHDNPHTSCDQKAFNGRCLEKLVNASDGADYSAGTMVWTLFDYYGEPPSAGLTVSSTYGQFDLCGFPKGAAAWFRTQWLLSKGDDRIDKPFPTNGTTEVYLVESWESPNSWNETRGNTTRTIHAYSNAPFVELYLNGKSRGIRPIVPMVIGNGGSYAEWESVPWTQPGTITAVARSSNGKAVAKSSRQTNTVPARLVLSLDAPSMLTGTGHALFLDGQDVALVRATIVDSNGTVSHMATNNVTFTVISGPGIIVGTANGDPKSYQSHVSTSQTAYHGLVRAIIRVTSIAGLSDTDRYYIQVVDEPAYTSRGSGSSNSSSSSDRYYHPSITDDGDDDDDDIVIEASSPGFVSVRLTIPTSTDPTVASVLAVAKATAGVPVNFFVQPK